MAIVSRARERRGVNGKLGNAKGKSEFGVRNLEIVRSFARKWLHQSRLPEKLDCPMHMQGIPGGARAGVCKGNP